MYPLASRKMIGGLGVAGGTAQYSQQILSLFGSSILAYFPMWETSGTVMTDIKNARNGTYTNVTVGQTPIRPPEGKSISVNGTTSQANAYTTGLRDAFNGAEGSIMVDAKAAAGSVWTDGLAHYFFRFAVDANNFIVAVKDAAANQLYIQYRGGGGATQTRIKSSYSPTARFHIALTWSLSNDRVRLYLDGVQVGADVTGLGTWAGLLASTAANFASYGSGVAGWSGWMQNALVLTREATPAEVASVNSFSLPEVTPPEAGGFTIVFLPDTQALVQSAAFREGLNMMMDWIVANKSTLNIRAVCGVGDIVETVGTAAEWTAANTSYGVLDADGTIPYLAPPGDHDYDNISTHDSTTYNTHFGQGRYTGQSWWAGGFQGAVAENAYNVITIDGTDYLFVMLETNPRAAILTWLDGLLTTHADKDVILLTHKYLQSDNTRDTPGNSVWNVIKTHANVIYVGCGNYVTPDGYGRLTSAADGGSDVHQVLFNTQTLDFGGPWLRVVKFHPDGTIDSETYSPVSRLKMTDSDNEFSLEYP